MKRTLFISLAFLASWSQAAIIDNSDNTYSSDGKAYVYFWTPNEANALNLNDGSNWRYLPSGSTTGELSGPKANYYPNSTNLAMIGYDYDATTGKFKLAATPTTTKFDDSWRGKSGIWLGNVTIGKSSVNDNGENETSLTLNIAKDANVVINGPIGWKTDTTTLNFGDVTGSEAKITQSGGEIWNMQNIVVNASLTMSGSKTTITRELMSYGGYKYGIGNNAPTSVTGNISVIGLTGEALTMRAGYVTSIGDINEGECALMFTDSSIAIVAKSKSVSELYWKGSGSGNWSDTVWAAAADRAGTLAYTNGVPVYFGDNGISGTVEINVDSSVNPINPTGMNITGGNYKFTGNSPLDDTDTLTVSGGVAEFAMDSIEAKSISISGATSSLTAKSVTVQTSMSMDSGNLKADVLKGSGAVEISGGSLEIGSIAEATGTINISGATLKGTTELSNANLQIGDVTVDDPATVSIKNGGTLTGAIEVEDGGTLTLEGAFRLTDALITDSENRYSSDGVETGTANGNGYANGITTYTVITGDLSTVDATNATWSEGKRIIIEYKYEQSSTAGTVTKTGLDLSAYYVNNDADITNLTLLNETTDIKINGKTLTIDETYNKPQVLSATALGGTINLGDNGVLLASDIANSTGTLMLDGSGTYYTNNSVQLHQSDSVSLADTWEGTVEAGDVSGTALDFSSLANASSYLILGDVQAGSVQLNAAKEVSAETLVLTSSTASTMKADTVAIESLTLGTKDTATSLTISGSLEMQGDITLGNEGSYLMATALSDTTKSLNFVMAGELIEKINTETVILTLTEASDAVVVTLNNAETIVRDKYTYSIGWKAADTKVVVITPGFNRAYYKDAAETQNGKAGADIITAMVDTVNPQNTAPDSVLAAVINNVDALIDGKATAAADKLMSAVAGASTAAMGAALSGDMQRQLRAIRNRTTTMGVDQCVVNHDMPYFNAWINAEGNRSELDADGTDAGYSMDSWGGTVGFDVDLSPQFTAGMAFTAMYGDFTAESEDMAKADMDTYYLSAFARYVSKRWTHTFVASVGMAETGMERTVSYAGDSYTTKGDSDGITLGAMYEVGYVFALDEDATACLQPVLNFTFTHSSLSGYTETGSDAALKVGDMDMTAFSVGVGARVQAAVGENLYNRSSILEARALAKFNMGDTNCEGDVAFAALPGATGNITSVDMGSVALELGAGLTIPLGQDSDALFFDASAEISSGYTNLNATAGYRINF